MELYETIINELYFQGITLLNELRKTFFLDMIDPSVTNIDTKYFNSVVIVYYADEDKINTIETDNENVESNKQNIPVILQHFINKKNKKEILSLRKFMIKLFLTLVSILILNLKETQWNH